MTPMHDSERKRMKKKSTNITLDFDLWLAAKNKAAEREISFNQLVKNGLRLVLNHDEAITIDEHGKVHNDLRGVFKK